MNERVKAFLEIAALAVSAKKRADSEYDGFMKFYRDVVEAIPSDAGKAFGNLSVRVLRDKKEEAAGIELSVTDFFWWKGEFEKGVRFVATPERVRLAMVKKLAESAEKFPLDQKERKALLSLLDVA